MSKRPNTISVNKAIEIISGPAPNKILQDRPTRKYSGISDHSISPTSYEGHNNPSPSHSQIERSQNDPGKPMPDFFRSSDNQYSTFSPLPDILRDLPPKYPSHMPGMKNQLFQHGRTNQQYPESSFIPAKKRHDNGKERPIPKHMHPPQEKRETQDKGNVGSPQYQNDVVAAIRSRLSKLQEDLAFIKQDHLDIIHEFDPDFEFELVPSEEKLREFAFIINTDENAEKYEKVYAQVVDNIDNQFCKKCAELTSKYQVHVSSIGTRDISTRAEIEELAKLTSEYDETSTELQEELAQAERELDMDSTDIYRNYEALKVHLKNYFQMQFSDKTEQSIDADVNGMINILLQQIICCKVLKELDIIEDLFRSSGHSNWILHARKQAVCFMLLQPPPKIETDLIIEAFQTKHQILLKPDNQGDLSEAINIAYRLSNYAIADIHYFKNGLTIEGLESLQFKDVETNTERSSSIKSIDSVITEDSTQKGHIEISVSPSQQTRQTPPSLPQKDYAVVPDNNPNSHVRNTSSLSSNGEGDTNFRAHSINLEHQQVIDTAEQTKRNNHEWEKHIKSSEEHDCGWCYIQRKHIKLEAMRKQEAKNDKKSLKSIDSNGKKLCSRESLCPICITLELHKHLKCKYKDPQKFTVNCKQCIKLREAKPNLFLAKESGGLFSKILKPKKSN